MNDPYRHIVYSKTKNVAKTKPQRIRNETKHVNVAETKQRVTLVTSVFRLSYVIVLLMVL